MSFQQGHPQYLRKASLLVANKTRILDLSEVHFRFKTTQQDAESPNNAEIRIYNLSGRTVALMREEYDRVVLQAGYDKAFGVIFDGTIKQFRVGKENATDTYIDLLAADGDLAYNFALVNKTLAAGWTHEEAIKAAIASMAEFGVQGGGFIDSGGLLGGTVPNPRGKVMFGLPRAILRNTVQNVGATWSINNGRVEVTSLDGYKPGDVVVLNSLTGLIGRAEQTQEGIKAKCLLNPRIDVGTRVRISPSSINAIFQQNPEAAPVPYNQWAGLQLLPIPDALDGIYRVFVAEHEGDTRGQSWFTNLTCLAVNPTTDKVERPNG